MVDPRSSIVATGAAFPVDDIRRRFPAIARAGRFIFFDNAAGAQVPASVVDAVTDHLTARNVQRGGPYGRSREVDAMIVRARESVAAFVNARSADEIAFGLNATSFMRALSLAVGQTIDPAGRGASATRSEIVVTELDHEANIATWLALERYGARIVWWRVRGDARLHPSDLEEVVGPQTRLIACTMASNATGSLVDVAGAARIARAAGAELFVDAVHYAPHGPIDVQAIDCDYLVCSGYKVFAPHMGFAWCRREAIAALPTFREHFIPDAMPDKLEAGTYSYESIAGVEAAIEYLHDLGSDAGRRGSRVETLRLAMTAIASYEQTLAREFLDAIEGIPGAAVHGVVDRDRLGERVPTLSFTVSGVDSTAIAAALATRDVGLRSGHMYSPRLIARLGLAGGGVVRASLVHYNTTAEIARFRAALIEVIDEARSG
jgi:cysteine desulfurase family protein (TIGR01976 family)